MDAADEEEWELVEDEEHMHLAAFTTLLVLGATQSRVQRIRRRNPTRLYLCRPQLMPNARVGTPWQFLYNSQDDRAFITTMGFDCETFEYILNGGFRHEWNSRPIPRNDSSPNGEPRLGARSLDATGALGLVLHFLSSAMLETSLQQIFALIPSTVSRYLDWGRKLFLEVLRYMPEGRVQFPQSEEEYQASSDIVTVRHPLLEGAFGTIDGLWLCAETSDDPETENGSYNSWTSSHGISNVLVWGPDGCVLSAALNRPGSWHDAHTARGIYGQLREETPEGFFLVADTAFPRGTAIIHGKIRAPLKTGQRISSDLVEQAAVLRENRQLLSYRQTAEWGMRTIQGSFGRLRVPLNINDPVGRQELLETCVRATNVRARRVGISQIAKVYMPIWRKSEDEKLWDNLGDRVFGEIRRRDRVSRFHITIAQI